MHIAWTIWLTSSKSIKEQRIEKVLPRAIWFGANQTGRHKQRQLLATNNCAMTSEKKHREREREGGGEKEWARKGKQSASKAVGRMRNAQLTNLIRQTLRHTQSCVCVCVRVCVRGCVCVWGCIYSCACVCACGHRKISFMTMHKNVAWN